MIGFLKDSIVYLLTVIKDPSLTTYYRYKGANIGNNCSFIGRNISFSSEPYLITIGNNVRVSFDVSFVTHDGGTYVLRKERPEAVIYGKIAVGNNVFIGARSIIMPNVIIGDNCIIGAGSIVTKNIPSNCVAAGVPAKVICSLDEYKVKHSYEILDIVNMPYEEKKQYLLKK